MQSTQKYVSCNDWLDKLLPDNEFIIFSSWNDEHRFIVLDCGFLFVITAFIDNARNK